MKTFAKIVFAVVLYYVLYVVLVILFPSYSQDAADYQRFLVEQQKDKEVMEAFIDAQKRGH